MRRAVITGYGIISSIGSNKQEVLQSLRDGTSGIEFVEEYRDKGFRSQVAGTVSADFPSLIDRQYLRFMGDGAAFNYLAMREAVEHAGLEPGEISHPRTGLVVGTGGASTRNLLEVVKVFESTRGTQGQAVHGLADHEQHQLRLPGHGLQDQGRSTTRISSACATSSHCIGHAADLVKRGEQDIVFAGGGEEMFWMSTVMFDSMGALSSKYNDSSTDRVTTLRRQSRWIRHLRWWWTGGDRGVRARQGPRCQDLCRADWLRSQLGRRRYGGSFRRRCRAVHAAGTGNGT